MKIRLNFNHEELNTLKALDSPYGKKQTNEMLNNVVSEYMQNDELTRLSELAQLIDRDIDYSAILLLATQKLAEEVDKKNIIRGILGFLKDDEII